ncbi:rab-GTPase-TBC domain-containing protein [Microdochium trichocladiopsis]|uniref:Rab-GTPase-TBC domain-containing protein n=1 Tax=Microdochium trichocladiopsis TaxID=1682393 RepID=A0A9P8YD58_9PEZI|nr:rab-GTPase-TBC domain-containing protein [Microdochium trichocladiopsis]KAH7039632.1 rab-GTPase-TBC domain-containing protein [Microdochium trichocladiopsis]
MARAMQPTDALGTAYHAGTPMDDSLHSHAFLVQEEPPSPRTRRAFVRRSRSLKLPSNYTMYSSKNFAPRVDSRRQAASASNSPQGSPTHRSFEQADYSDTMISSAASTSFTQNTRSSNSTALTAMSSHTDDFTLPSPVPSPRWDSMGYKQPYNTHDYTRSSPIESHDSSLAWETRDEFPTMYSQPSSRIVSAESAPVENFSRPRNASIKQQQWSDPSRLRSASNIVPEHDAPSAAARHRDRGQSNSSNQSAATYASLPTRTAPDYYQRDAHRGRPARPNPAPNRQLLPFSRAESSGPTFARDPLPRMASMPSDELRSSYRSQLTSSTVPGTFATETERSSVLTKYSSVLSVYDDVDDGFSVDDVMGMYEKGFDDSGDEDNGVDDSRPTTSRTEQVSSGSTFHGIEDVLPQPPRIGGPPEDEPLVRDSAAFFRPLAESEQQPQQPVQAVPEPKTQPIDDSDDDDDDFPFRPAVRQQTNMTTTADQDRDRYGFRKKNQYITEEQYDNWNGGYSEYLARRKKKWNALLKENGLMTDNPNRFPPRSAKTKRYVRKGIPPEWRGAAWFYYAGGPAIVAQHAGLYDNLRKKTAKAVDVEAIERDLHRTFPDNIKFRSTQPATGSSETNTANGPASASQETPMISSLRRVLLAFAIYNPRIGYCQSLNFLAGLLLLFVENEEQAFWLLNIITRVYLPGTHEVSLEGANVDLAVLMAQIRDTMPAVWNKIGSELDGTEAARPSRSLRGKKKADLSTRLPPITLCMTPWFMSCFIGTLPIESALRVWDVFFYEGSRTLFRIALTIFKTGEPEIKAVKDPMEIFQTVQTIPRRLIDANVLMESCFKRRNGFGHVSQESIEQKRQERRVLVNMEKEKLARGDANDFDAAEAKRKPTIFNRRK